MPADSPTRGFARLFIHSCTPFDLLPQPMTSAADQLGVRVRRLLRRGPLAVPALASALEVDQHAPAQALRPIEADLVRFSHDSSVRIALRDEDRSDLETLIYEVSATGTLKELGTLVPVRPEGYVLVHHDGTGLHSEGLPWWLNDLRPQGYLGRIQARRLSAELGLPLNLEDWSDTHALRALIHEGEDLPGNLIVGQAAADRFLAASPPVPIPSDGKGQAYAALAAAAARGEHHGALLGGEQPKFTAYVECPEGPAHVLVKFSDPADTAASQRWRDLLLAEHLALEVLREQGIPAAQSAIIDHAGQRFLEVRRFDREGHTGRRGVVSIGTLDDEFVGSGGTWPQVTRALVTAGIVHDEAIPAVDLLWAFGTLIGNTDMHGGNLSFSTERGRNYQLAPAYDMVPMAFAPPAESAVTQWWLDSTARSVISAEVQRRALRRTQTFLQRLEVDGRLSGGFAPCIGTVKAHLAQVLDGG